MKTAKDIMSPQVITISQDATIKELSQTFLEYKVNGIPVVDENDEIIGIVTEGDLIGQNKSLHVPTVVSIFDAVIYLESDKKFKEEISKISATSVREIFTPKVVSVTPDTPIQECGAIMSEKEIHTLPVLENGKLVGIIGKLDLIRGMLHS